MSTLKAQIASVPDQAHAVLEIWDGIDQLAQVSARDADTFDVEIFSRSDGASWRVNLNQLLAALELAMVHLVDATTPDPTEDTDGEHRPTH